MSHATPARSRSGLSNPSPSDGRSSAANGMLRRRTRGFDPAPSLPAASEVEIGIVRLEHQLFERGDLLGGERSAGRLLLRLRLGGPRARAAPRPARLGLLRAVPARHAPR